MLHSWLHIGIPLCSEYPALLSPNLESERVYKPYIIASYTEVSKNYKLINEDGGVIDSSIQRSADDYSIWDDRCEALNLPFSNCTSRNWATQRSSERPPCMDNNNPLIELSNCIYSNGTESEYCAQVRFSQNAFIGQCKDYSDPNCGTFLEVHMPKGSPYQSED